MATRLIVDKANQLKELKEQPKPVQLFAKLISYIFHPVFVPIYIILFLLYIHPGVFAGFSPFKKTLVLLQGLLPYLILPIVTVLLLKALNFVNNINLATQRDRIIPYIACNVWYFWIAYVWYNLPDYPMEIVFLSAGIFLASVIGQLANIYMKISMHGIAMGLLVSFVFLLGIMQAANAGLYIAISLIIAGAVCSSRLIVSGHNSKEIYAGLVAGIAGLLIAVLFISCIR